MDFVRVTRQNKSAKYTNVHTHYIFQRINNQKVYLQISVVLGHKIFLQSVDNRQAKFCFSNSLILTQQFNALLHESIVKKEKED